jgi:ribosome-associated protein
VVLEVGEIIGITDFFVIGSGRSTRQVRTVADEVESVLRDAQIRPRRREGRDDAHWILLDFGVVVVHIFDEEARDYYDLERLWADAPRVALRTLQVGSLSGSRE